ncbi:MAG: hypothetical protein MJA82_01565 [Clostridia bacterium]|nr:hypothetical protein [Clostridia bacterium]
MNEIIISINNLSVLDELDMHDGKLGEIKCDYANHEVWIPIELDSPKKRNIKAIMRFNYVKMFSMKILEPWGAGMYVNEVKYKRFKEVNSEICFEVTIILNSGDVLKIASEQIEYNEVV